MKTRPRPLGDTRKHFLLATGMANRTGADLQHALDVGDISHQDWADMIQRCRGCDWAKGCACWLAAQSRGGASAPDRCENQSVFAALCKDHPAKR